MANYSTASRVLQVIRASETSQRMQSHNRGKVLKAANCEPPLTEEDAKKLGMKVNCNFGELLIQVVHASGQLMTAFHGNQNFFTVKLPAAPRDKKEDWEQFITSEINRPLRESNEYFVLHLNRWKCLTLHGVSPMMWMNDDHWLPRFVSLSDLIIPTDTTIDYVNLNEFTQLVPYTVFELAKEAFKKTENNHWAKEQVLNILQNVKEINTLAPQTNYQVGTDVEKFIELIHQNGGFYGSDAIPTIPLYHFYFKDFDKNGREAWFLRIVPQSGVIGGADTDKFLWESDEPVAYSWKELLNCQYGDLSGDTPAKHGSVRGLGFVLLEPTFYTNLARCGMLQHLMDQFQTWLRITDPAEKARAQIQEFGAYKVLRTGVGIVPASERHQVDNNLIEMVLGNLKQLQGEASASYTQQADTGTQKEQTAFETRVKLEQVNALMGAILTMAFKFEAQAQREIARRFCLKISTDPDINKFQRRCKAFGVPPEWIDVEQWEVEPVTPLGWGNPSIAAAAAEQMLKIRPMLNPQAQEKVLHEYVAVTTKDPRKAQEYVPLDGKPKQSEASREATGLFATLLTGIPIALWPQNLIDQINTLIPLLAGRITMLTQGKGMANQEEAVGMNNALQYLEQAVQQLEQDETQRQLVKEYSDSLGKLSNEIKGLAQRGEQHAKAQGQAQADGEAGKIAAEGQAKIQNDKIVAESKARELDAKTGQELSLAERQFEAEEKRKQQAFDADQRRKDAAAMSDIETNRLKANV